MKNLRARSTSENFGHGWQRRGIGFKKQAIWMAAQKLSLDKRKDGVGPGSQVFLRENSEYFPIRERDLLAHIICFGCFLIGLFWHGIMTLSAFISFFILYNKTFSIQFASDLFIFIVEFIFY